MKIKKMFGLLFLFVLFLSFAPDFKIQALEPRTNVVILSIGYIPRDPVNTDYVNRSETGTDIPLNTKVIDVSNKINYLTTQGMSILTDSSRYKGYRESSPAAVSYQLVEPTRFVYQPLPRGMLLSGNTYRPDYRTILTNLDICRYVDQLGVNQVWLWGYHSPTLVPVESNMSMGETSRAFFNRGSFGDVSNSERTDDLPRCQSTYVLYNYNYGREIGEVLENHTHQLEAVLRYANTFNEPKDPVGSALFWNNFVGATNTSPSITKPGCGWTHYPPNGRSDYDWYNTTPVMSDCEDWLPGGGGTTKSISCQTWSKTNACPDDGGVSFKRWWMQNLPGLNNGLTHNGKPLKNWWLFVSDFDYAMKVGGGLLVTQASPSPSPSPTPTPTPSPTSTPTATPTPVPSRLDINNDGKVDIFDYSMLISEYGKTTATRSDINDDGIVNMIDITIFLEGFPRLS